MTTSVAIGALPALSTELAALGERLRAGTVQIQVRGRGIGSGIVWQVADGQQSGQSAPSATIITNAHVVRATGGMPLTVRLHDGRELPAEAVAMEPEHDLAALRVTAEGLTPLEIGDSSALRVGELVVAVGNPSGREGALTAGVVAARAPAPEDAKLEPAEEEWRPGGRGPWLRGAELIQADLRLYPGNSGGPLTDAAGRVVGVNAMISGGLAFAIPSRLVRDFLGRVERPARRGRLGVEVLTVPLPTEQRDRLGLPAPAATLVTGVESGSPAERAGIQPGDLIVAVGSRPIMTAEHLLRALVLEDDATDLRVTVIRGGTRLDLGVAPELLAA